MKRLVFALATLLISVGAFSQSVADEILGKWTNQDQTRIIEFVKNGSTYDAVVRKAENTEVVDKKQITGLTANGKKNYKNGVIHILQKGKTVNCKAELIDEDKLEIKASKGMISKSQVWTRYKDENN